MTALQSLPAPVTAYLKELERALEPLPAEERDDVLRELAGHLEDGLASGQAPEALLAGMGPAREVAEAIVGERMVAIDQRRTPRAIAGIVARAIGKPYLVTLAILFTLMILNTLYLYAELITARRVPPGTVAFLMLYNVPAIVVVTLPIAALMAGLVGLPKLATVLSAPTLRRLHPRLIAGGLGLGLVLSGLGLVLNDTIVPKANRMTVDLVSTFILQQELTPEVERSPQERTLAEADRRIATMRSEREARVKAGAPFQEVEKLDAALHASEVDRHLKLAIPAYALPLMALGLALGSLLARRKPVPVWVHVVIGFATTVAIYTAMNVARFSLSLHDAPELAAWGPLLLPTLVAALVWAYAAMARKGAFADV